MADLIDSFLMAKRTETTSFALPDPPKHFRGAELVKKCKQTGFFSKFKPKYLQNYRLKFAYRCPDGFFYLSNAIQQPTIIFCVRLLARKPDTRELSMNV